MAMESMVRATSPCTLHLVMHRTHNAITSTTNSSKALTLAWPPPLRDTAKPTDALPQSVRIPDLSQSHASLSLFLRVSAGVVAIACVSECVCVCVSMRVH